MTADTRLTRIIKDLEEELESRGITIDRVPETDWFISLRYHCGEERVATCHHVDGLRMPAALSPQTKALIQAHSCLYYGL